MQSNEGGYLDWDATLTVDEFKELHERYRLETQTGVYAHPHWQHIIAQMMQVLDGALAGGVGEIDKVEVNVFEWESGLD